MPLLDDKNSSVHNPQFTNFLMGSRTVSNDSPRATDSPHTRHIGSVQSGQKSDSENEILDAKIAKVVQHELSSLVGE